MLLNARSIFLTFAAIINLFFASFASAEKTIEKQRLVITGSSSVALLVLEIAKRFEEANPQVRVDVQTGGSSRGVADARSGVAHIGMASRALSQTENDLFAHTIALDGIAVIVHVSNPINSLSDAEIKQIYTGQINNWNQLGGREWGGEDKKITVVNKAEGRSTLELFLHYLKLTNSDVKASVIIGDNQQGIKTVAGNPSAIGYVSVGAAEYEAQNGTPIKLLPLNGVVASVAQVQAGNFPLSRPLNLVTRTQPTGLVKQFIDYARSGSVQDLVAEQYFVSVAMQ
jgi:phosphate transport system substrate-binding protein